MAGVAARSALLLVGLIALPGCGRPAGTGEAVESEQIACSTGNAQQLAKTCTLEHLARDGRLLMTVRHADGGFRSFERVDDERALIPADGAAVAHIAVKDDIADVSIDGDRYLIPLKAGD